jgi:ADP-heptose:LPS heptosyltransferase
MHIAAAVGTPCVAVFSARLGLGKWFPHGSQQVNTRQRVLYNRTSCSPCNLEICTAENKRCILSITPEQVSKVALELLAISN